MDRHIMRLALLVVCALACTAGAAHASTIEYMLDLPAAQRLAYRIEFEVAHPGIVTLDASWSPSRVLVFRLERPGERPLRLAGPSPQRFEVEVAPDAILDASPWTLVISGLPSRDAASGRLSIDLPDWPAAPVGQEHAAGEDAPAPREDGWRLPAEAPRGAGYRTLQLYETVERFRRQVVGQAHPDDYRWQDGMLRYLAAQRDLAAAGSSPLSRPAETLLARLVDTVRELDDLRFAESRPLGPTPTDTVVLRAWNRVRDPRFEPLEDELDALMADLHRGHAPRLERELWLTNLLSCLTVCQRHFEERARLGEHRASHATLVGRQWPAILAAADALEALGALR